MSISLVQVDNDLRGMENTLSHVISLSEKIGSFEDGPHLRESIQSDVKTLMTFSKNVKGSLTQLRERNENGVDNYEQRFEDLRAKMQNQLPGVISSLRNNSFPENNEGTGSPLDPTPLLDQSLLDSQTDQLDELEQSINQILQTMKEVKALFTQTLDELQQQRHILVNVDKMTSTAQKDAASANDNLETAEKHQKGSTNVLCWILIILLIVCAGVGIFLGIWIPKHKKKNNDTPSNTTSLHILGMLM